jgi:hypothetical protein
MTLLSLYFRHNLASRGALCWPAVRVVAPQADPTLRVYEHRLRQRSAAD